MNPIRSLLTGVFAAGCLSVGVAASPALAIDLSESVDVPVAGVKAWTAILDFCSIKDWHPVIAACEQFDQDGKTMRRLTTGDGGELLEELIEMDDPNMSMRYAIIESPLPIADYVSTIAVTEAGDGATITWSSSFNAAGVPDEEALELMTGIYKAGLDELASQLSP
jgi:hypothetical protein